MIADLFGHTAQPSRRTVHEVHLLAGRCQVAVTRNGEGGVEVVERLGASSPQRAQIIDAVIAGLGRRSLDDVTLQTSAMLDFCLALQRIRHGEER